MSFLASILPALIVLGILIIIHELGHFIACRISGVKVEKFSIGFGPEIFAWQGKETRYTLSLLPLGGFVKPAGESVSDTEAAGGPKAGDYLAAPLFSKIFIVVAGVLMNYVLAFVLFVGIFMAGRPIPGTTIATFVDGYPAATSGLQKGDRITSVQAVQVETWNELMMALDKAPEGPLTVSVDRKGELQTVLITPKTEEVKDVFGSSVKLRRLGITPDAASSKFEKYGFVHSLKMAWDTVYFQATMTYKAVAYLVMGKLSMKTLSGPIGIITMTGNAVDLGWTYLLQLAASLSISLAVINLLPIPALDGGHLVFLLVEGLIRRPVSLKVQERATQVGFYLLLGLMVFVIYNDIVNLEVVERVKNIFIK